jgi:ParB family transcriptional regulator, chromosome partitioning protein
MSITVPESEHSAPDAALVAEIDAIGLDTEPTEEASCPAALEVVPIPTIPRSALIRNPKNPRSTQREKPDADLLASVKEDGFVDPFIITKTDDPAVFMIFDGHLRMDVAEHLKIDDIPYAFDPSLADDPVAHHLIAVITQKKKKLTALQTANVLFAAAEAGASKSRLARAYGCKAGAVDQVLKVARMPETARRAAEAAAYAWDITELVALDEFAGDEEATGRLVQAAEEGTFAYQVERERIERTEHAQRAKIRAKLKKAGITVLDEEPEGGLRLNRLRDPEKGLTITAELHAGCPGHVAVFETFGEPRTAYWCTDPKSNGHQDWHSYSPRPVSAKTQDAAARRTVIQGNKDHKAAETVRRAWLRGLIAGAASMEKEAIERVSRFAALVTLTAPDPVRKFAAAIDREDRQADLLGMSGSTKEQWEQAVDGANPRRLVMMHFANVAAAYEKALTKDVWRTDLPPSEYSGADRKHARVWLSFCAQCGHTLSPIEKAIVADESYTPADLGAGSLMEQGEPGDEDDEEEPEDGATTDAEHETESGSEQA